MRDGRLLWVVLGAIFVGIVLLIAGEQSGTVLGMENDAFASTLYLGVIGLVIAAGLVGSRISTTETLRNVAIWLAIAVALVLGYQLYQ